MVSVVFVTRCRLAHIAEEQLTDLVLVDCACCLTTRFTMTELLFPTCYKPLAHHISATVKISQVLRCSGTTLIYYA